MAFIDLQSNDLCEIDLAPVASLNNLQVLYLGDNLLNSINIRALANCKALVILRLTRNNLKEIDLSPLKSCKYLRKIQLARNQIEKLDLDPLRGKQYLDEINLDRNPFSELDLSALEDVPRVDFIDLTKISKESKVDVTPILSNHSDAWVNLSEEEDFSVDAKKLADYDLNHSRLIEEKSILNAIDFENDSKELLESKTNAFAKKAVEKHENVEDLLVQRLLEDRSEVSAVIRKRVRELGKQKQEKLGSKADRKTSD